jgi:N-methylhydantoinase A/oxoprolinase/acetone carboxylase beta subunit
MAICLGIDTGGTFTDAVLIDPAARRVIARAKALTTRPDPAGGIAAAVDAVLAAAPEVAPGAVALVGLSTTLATNALVEGRAERAALVTIGLGPAERARAGLPEALGADPLIALAGGHDHAGTEVTPLDLAALEAGLAGLPQGIAGVAVAGAFATRNPRHEMAARAAIRAATGLPVTCSHELSAGLGAPKRALTALLNARLIGLIDRLVGACEGHLAARGIAAPLMVVRGDGALVAAALVRERPVETILSGPAASAVGARWLTGLDRAVVADIGGTTTDVCLLDGGRPRLDPEGAQVGGWRTMVQAVAMRTAGLGGDSEVAVEPGLAGGLRLGPRRVVPLALAAVQHPAAVRAMLAQALAMPAVAEGATQLVWALGPAPAGLEGREAELMGRLAAGPLPRGALVRARIEAPALERLVARGLVAVADVTPTDAAHVLGRQSGWDRTAAEAGLALLAKRRRGDGQMLAADAAAMAAQVLEALTRQTVAVVLETAFAEAARAEGRDLGAEPAMLARHPLVAAALERAPGGLVALSAHLGVPLVGLGASAACHYGQVGARLGCELVVPPEAGVANAVGAVVGPVEVALEGVVTCPGPGLFVAHLPEGPARFADLGPARARLIAVLEDGVRARAGLAGLDAPVLAVADELIAAEVEGQRVPVELRLRVTASGRPRMAGCAAG